MTKLTKKERLEAVILGVVLALTTWSAAADAPNEQIRVEAIVQKYEIAAMEDAFDDGRFVNYDGATLKVLSPAKVAGKTIRVYVPSGAVAANSPMRNPGAQCRFNFDPNLLNQGQLFLGALENLRWTATAILANESPEDLLRTWAATWLASDVDKMLSFYSKGKEVTAIESLGHIRRGSIEIGEMYRGAFDELTFDRVTLTPLAQGQRGDVAWATCRYRADIRIKEDNSKYVLEVRGSFVMRKDKNSWKIVLEHFSTIPDTPRVRPADN